MSKWDMDSLCGLNKEELSVLVKHFFPKTKATDLRKKKDFLADILIEGYKNGQLPGVETKDPLEVFKQINALNEAGATAMPSAPAEEVKSKPRRISRRDQEVAAEKAEKQAASVARPASITRSPRVNLVDADTPQEIGAQVGQNARADWHERGRQRKEARIDDAPKSRVQEDRSYREEYTERDRYYQEPRGYKDERNQDLRTRPSARDAKPYVDPREQRGGYRSERQDLRYEPRQDRRPFPQDIGYSDYDHLNDEPEEELTAVFASGILDVLPDGYGFLRTRNYKPGSNDIFVSAPHIKRYRLRIGDMITGQIMAPKHGENFFGISRIVSVNGIPPEEAMKRPMFDQLTPVFPNVRYTLENDSQDLSTRLIDMFAPIGKGQRGLIVSPPKAGKTILLKKIAKGITANFPDTVLIALLIDERPEEVTDMDRSIKGEVIASTFDEDPNQHIHISQLVLERARRLVEMGKDVVVLMDSLTRMGRACNNTTPPSGRTLSGGLDVSALRMPKRFFGSARNVENGGSLTVIASALIETGSKMDEVIFEEFKGTGNMELDLSRKLAERRVFPAIDIKKSGTRHDELLLEQDMLGLITKVRRHLDTICGEQDPTEKIMELMKNTTSNREFINSLQR